MQKKAEEKSVERMQSDNTKPATTDLTIETWVSEPSWIG